MSKIKSVHLKLIIFGLLIAVIIFFVPRLNYKEMRMISVFSIVMVKDMGRSLEFYEKILGFKILKPISNSANSKEVLMGKDDVAFILRDIGDLNNKFDIKIDSFENRSVVLEIGIDNLLYYIDKLKDKTNIINEVDQSALLRTSFAIQDPDGNIILFTEKADEK